MPHITSKPKVSLNLTKLFSVRPLMFVVVKTFVIILQSSIKPFALYPTLAIKAAIGTNPVFVSPANFPLCSTRPISFHRRLSQAAL